MLISGNEELQRWPEKWAPGLMNFVPAVAYHPCPNLPEQLSQPGDQFQPSPVHRLLTAALAVVAALDAPPLAVGVVLAGGGPEGALAVVGDAVGAADGAVRARRARHALLPALTYKE